MAAWERGCRGLEGEMEEASAVTEEGGKGEGEWRSLFNFFFFFSCVNNNEREFFSSFSGSDVRCASREIFRCASLLHLHRS